MSTLCINALQVQDTMLSLTSQMGEMVRACRDSLSSR